MTNRDTLISKCSDSKVYELAKQIGWSKKRGLPIKELERCLTEEMGGMFYATSVLNNGGERPLREESPYVIHKDKPLRYHQQVTII